MSEKFKLPSISEDDIKNKGVQALDDRPNRSGKYGQGGLSAKELKAWFDNLTTLLAKNTRDVSDAFNSVDAAKYIKLSKWYSSLFELIEAMDSGGLVTNLLKAKESGALSAQLKTLQDIINSFAKDISINKNNLDNLSCKVDGNTNNIMSKTTVTENDTHQSIWDATGVIHYGKNDKNYDVVYVDGKNETGDKSVQISDSAASNSIPVSDSLGQLKGNLAEFVVMLGAGEDDLLVNIKYVNKWLKYYYNKAKEYTDEEIAALVDSAPDTLNTLKELADAISEHQEVTKALDSAIGNKLNKVPFTSDEKGKAVSVGENGKLVAEEELVTKAYVKEEAAKAQGTVYANALKGVASGAVIRVDDVSPLTHNMGVKVISLCKNLLKTTNYTKGTIISASGLTSSGSFAITTDYIPLRAGNYIISYIKGATGIDGAHLRGIAIYDNNKTFTKYIWSERKNNYEFTIESACFVRIDIERSGVDGAIGAGSNPIGNHDAFFNDYKIQLELGTTATEYEPYFDVSEVKVSRYGKNLASNNVSGWHQYQYYPLTIENNVMSSTIASGNYNKQYLLTHFLPGSYTASAIFENYKCFIVQPYDSKGNFKNDLAGYPKWNNSYNGYPFSEESQIKFTVPEDVAYWRLGVVFGGAEADIGKTTTVKNLQLEIGNVCTEFEEFEKLVSYTAESDGNVKNVSSISPTTTLIPDNPNVTIEVEYNKDINTVLDNAAALPTVGVGDAGKFLVVDTLGNIVTTTIETGGGY